MIEVVNESGPTTLGTDDLYETHGPARRPRVVPVPEAGTHGPAACRRESLSGSGENVPLARVRLVPLSTADTATRPSFSEPLNRHPGRPIGQPTLSESLLCQLRSLNSRRYRLAFDVRGIVCFVLRAIPKCGRLSATFRSESRPADQGVLRICPSAAVGPQEVGTGDQIACYATRTTLAKRSNGLIAKRLHRELERRVDGFRAFDLISAISRFSTACAAGKARCRPGPRHAWP
jgi:hypothetical protein